MGVSQRTISRWERGDGRPSMVLQKRLRDLGWEPPGSLLQGLAAGIAHCAVPRALTRTNRLRLYAVSRPAIVKRPSIVDWIERDLDVIASGVLQEILDDRLLQRAIVNKEIASLLITSKSVLRTPEADDIGAYQTSVTYFFHEGTLYSDAISAPAERDIASGYWPVAMDDAGIGCRLGRGQAPLTLASGASGTQPTAVPAIVGGG